MSEMQRETDLVLNPNEYAYVLDKTKGLISCVVGSYKMSLSTSDSLVRFDEKTKRFEPCSFAEAITTFTSAPENWYVQLKNPTNSGSHPTPGTSNQLPDLKIGEKVNIRGPVSFALYPGQMARVIEGHRLNSNQFLLVKVYDKDALLENEDPEVERLFFKKESVSTPDEDVVNNIDQEYVSVPNVGEIFVIKGTETQFFIPPTGVEVIPIEKGSNQYVRDAVTLERLEYCILKNESGEKKYIHGPSVVFPEPDEVFVLNKDTDNVKFRAIELNDISGVYIKVIADYFDEKTEEKHYAGEELFITGKDQKIYYPRAEHSIISYDNHIVNHAIAIPEGEGRYVMNRLTGKIRMEKGPSMFLPDPREEVIVNRKLTKKQCELWYPGNADVLRHNCGLDAGTLVNPITLSANAANDIKGVLGDRGIQGDPGTSGYITTNTAYCNSISTTATYHDDSEASADVGIRRKNRYTKPRSITIDNKYDGVVSIDIWTGYAVNVVSKSGDRKVVVGPKTYLMEYDESLEVLELSTGKPKTTDNLLRTVYLRVENNKISDIIKVETKDFVSIEVKVSYCVDFLEKDKDKWFSVDNYVKYLTDRERSLVKREAKKYTVEEFYNKANDIVRTIALDINDKKDIEAADSSIPSGRYFKENGMLVHDVEILSVYIGDCEVANMINEHQQNIIRDSLKLSSSIKENEINQQIVKMEKEMEQMKHDKEEFMESLTHELNLKKLKDKSEIAAKEEEEKKRHEEAKKALQEIILQFNEQQREDRRKDSDLDIAIQKQEDELTKARESSKTANMVEVIKAISPKLAAAMENRTNAELMSTVTESVAPYAMAEGVPVHDFVNKLLRGTSMEDLIEGITKNITQEED